MTTHNIEIAEKFNKLANLLEIEGQNPYRIRAYRNAARVIASLSKNIADMIEQGEDLTALPGIGKDLAEKIQIMIKTGEFPLLTEIEAHVPPLLNDLMKVEGLGPKRVKLLYKKLKIKNIDDLKTAIDKGRVQKLAGFGEKTEQKILQGIQRLHHYTQHFKLADAINIAAAIIRYLKSDGILNIVCAGSYRRHKEVIGDLDIVVAAKQKTNVIERFIHYNEVVEIISHGTTKSAVRLRSGIQVDLRVVPEKSYGAALLYFTGSKPHNIAIRKLALRKKLKINEYGVFKGKKYMAGRTEEEVYHQIGLPYIEPELREDRGEIEAAQAGRLPKLIKLPHIRGDLHCHTNATDGTASLVEMTTAAELLGYEYLAITDHSKRLAMTSGFDKKALLMQIKSIDKLNAKLKTLTILKSIEVDILENGTLDLPDTILKELDLVVCAVHSKFNLTSKKQTDRILRALDKPFFMILAHPTGRLIQQREPYSINLERIILAAKEHGHALELNAQPERLDLSDLHCQLAKEMGVKIAISSDAHSPAQLAFMEYGVYQARRGWLEKNDVINTLSLKELQKLCRKNK